MQTKNNGSPKIGDMIARNPKDYSDQWLVAEQYFKDNFEQVSEGNGNKLNNNINNIEWCSRSANIKHSYTNKLRVKKPEESSKLSWDDAEDIRNLHQSGLNYKEISKMFNVVKSQIGKIIRREQWK